MNNSLAYDVIKDQYDLDTLKEIAEHGCASGVATNHIYYFETAKFFDLYQEEVLEYIEDLLGTEYLIETFKTNEAHLTGYKNDVVWTYIELVAGQIVDDAEELEVA